MDGVSFKGTVNTPYVDMSSGYSCMFVSWKFTELYTNTYALFCMDILSQGEKSLNK